jgi:hypothetical protein
MRPWERGRPARPAVAGACADNLRSIAECRRSQGAILRGGEGREE